MCERSAVEKTTIEKIARAFSFEYGHMTLGECIQVAEKCRATVGSVILQEAQDVTGKSREEVVQCMEEAFSHNLRAAEIGTETGNSFLLGKVGQELTGEKAISVAGDPFIDKIIAYTLAAQVGNHTIGLCPCAGTGDSCPYTGFVKAMKEFYSDEEKIARVMAVILKIGGIFRVGKRTTGCNMEGIGAGAAAVAAAFVELKEGTPAQMEKAVVLALSPTISVPCTPRVLVPGLCATHIGGGIMIARLASQLAMYTSVPSTVPVDVMIAMAAQCHLVSARHVVPVTIEYMEPFFKHDDRVDSYVEPEKLEAEKQRQRKLIEKASSEIRELSRRANPVTAPFGEAVVGGSSQGVGSPTNCARIAHFLSEGEVKKVKIELYSELFARRAINVPGILMAAIDGAGTSDAKAYKESLNHARSKGIEVEITEVSEPSVQRVTVIGSKGTGMVDSLNRGGARLVLRDAFPSTELACELARKLNIVLIDE